jgi:monoterpene epsilon-lactone hydrolase
MPSTEHAAVMEHLRLVGGLPAPSSGGLAGMRRMTEIYSSVSPACGRLLTTVTPVDVDGVPGEWHTTPGADPSRRLLYLHGGGWMAGSLASHRSLVSAIAAAFGGVALAVDYRLAPENAYPAGLDDCLTAYQWLRSNGPDGPADAGFVAIAGDSAGGNLTLASLLMLRDSGTPLPDRAVALSPLTDFSGDGDSRTSRQEADPIIPGGGLGAVANAYTQGNAPIDSPYVSPIEGDLAGLPPLMLLTGDAEVLLSDSVDFAAKAEAAGVEVTLDVWDHMPHVFPLFTGFLPEADEAIGRIAAFLGR